MTFKDRQLNSITCQAWKTKFLNSMTSQVSEIQAHEPWISGRELLFFWRRRHETMGASSLEASSLIAKIPRGSTAAKKVA